MLLSFDFHVRCQLWVEWQCDTVQSFAKQEVTLQSIRDVMFFKRGFQRHCVIDEKKKVDLITVVKI